MIHIQLTRYNSKLLVQAKGHALFAESGQDTVCAAVSTLIQTWQLSCDLLGGGIEVEDLSKGSFSATTEETSVHLVLWKSLVLGLQMIATRYPKNIKINLEE